MKFYGKLPKVNLKVITGESKSDDGGILPINVHFIILHIYPWDLTVNFKQKPGCKL